MPENKKTSKLDQSEAYLSSTHPYAIHGLDRNIKLKVVESAKAEIIAIEICLSNHGDFLKSIAHAFHKADRANKEIIRDAWYKLIEKYELEKEYRDAIEEHLDEYLLETRHYKGDRLI